MLGSHLSISGGLVNALLEAERLNMETVQIFTQNQRQWSPKPPEPEAMKDWLTELHRLGWTKTVSHSSYLINLASPADENWAKSIDAMTAEIKRCEQLEIPYAVVHPGSHMGSGEEAGVARIAKAIDEITTRTRGYHTSICLETTAGGGRLLGGRFEHLAAVREAVAEPERVSVCLDTCHITAAGYDISTAKKVKAVFAEFEAIIGFEHLTCFHFNDSKGEVGSHLDRHEHIGDGHVGNAGFAFILNEPQFRDCPMILETAKKETEEGTPWDTVNIRRLRKLIKGGASRKGAAGKSTPASRRKPKASATR